jgi:putative transcriptional regulator
VDKREVHTRALVKELRDRLGLTQEQFAHKLGVTYSTVNNWENGKRLPQPFLRRRLLEMKEELDARDRRPTKAKPPVSER